MAKVHFRPDIEISIPDAAFEYARMLAREEEAEEKAKKEKEAKEKENPDTA